MTVQCSICEHAQRANIEAEVRAGKTALAVAAKYGISRQALGRHIRKSHVAPDPSATIALPALSQSAALVSAEDLLREAITSLRSVDVTKLSTSAQSAHFDAMRRAAESLARVAAPPEVDNDLREEVAELKADAVLVSTAIQKLPGVNAVVALALARARGREPHPSTVAAAEGVYRLFGYPGVPE